MEEPVRLYIAVVNTEGEVLGTFSSLDMSKDKVEWFTGCSKGSLKGKFGVGKGTSCTEAIYRARRYK